MLTREIDPDQLADIVLNCVKFTIISPSLKHKKMYSTFFVKIKYIYIVIL